MVSEDHPVDHEAGDVFVTPSGRLPDPTRRLLAALDGVLDAARAIERSNRGYAVRSDRTGRRLDAQRYRACADVAFRLADRVEHVRRAAADGAFS